MAFDIDAKIKELVREEGKLLAEIRSLQRDGYWKEDNRKSKELLKLQQELLKYRNLKAMMNKDTAEILRLSGFTVDADEQWITMNGAHVKIEGGESKASAAKNFISSKKEGSKNLGNKSEKETQKTNKSSSISEGDLTEEEIKEIKEKFSKIDEPTSLTGSEFGEYVSKIQNKLRKAGKYPDLSEYDKINDKMISLREKGKKDTEEYKTLERQRKDWNKNFNKIDKEIRQKAYNLSSEKEKKRLDEIHSFFKRNPSKMGDAEVNSKFKKVMEEYGKGELESSSGEKVTDPKQAKAIAYSESEDGDTEGEEKIYTKGTEDGWKHYRDSKGNIWELVNAQGSFWMMECIKGPRKGDTVTFRKEMVESSMTEDACSKDSDPKVAEAETIINLCGGVK